MRSVIIHNHLFKNAGSSFDWVLQKNFGDDFVDHREDQEMIEGAKYLGPFLQKHKNIKALSSHFIKFPLPIIEEVNLFPAIILRHPVDRIGSVYAFERIQESNSLGARAAKRMNFAEYVEWRLRPDIPITIRNFQTSRCLDVPENIKSHISRKLNESDFKHALHRINNTNLLGIVELYDESMVVFEDFLKPFYPDIDLSYKRKNITDGRKKDILDRVLEVFAGLNLSLINKILLNNHWDLALYAEGKAILEERIKNVKDFQQKLENFHKRCSSL